MTRHFLRDDDLSPAEQLHVLRLATEMKRQRFAYRSLEGPLSVAMIFDMPSTRTRVSFATGIAELGGNPLALDTTSTQASRGEPVDDTARVLGRMVSAIVWRTGEHSRLEAMAAMAGVPVINALSDDFHPCQLLADLLTVKERFGATQGRTAAFLGDVGSNMAQSWMLAGATAGMHIRLAGPSQLTPSAEVVARSKHIAQHTGGSIAILTDAKAAAYEADVLVTDTWHSMGQSAPEFTVLEDLSAFRLNEDLLSVAAEHAVVLHCLPAYRGEEITSQVLDGPRSVVWDEAENRLHAQKALLTFLLEPDKNDLLEREKSRILANEQSLLEAG